MKKTFTINLGGIIFHIDDDAYQLLNQYLESLKRHFSVMEDSREILDDIESRIAEILQEELSETRQVITLDDINRVMRMMGKPDEIGEKKEELAAAVEDAGEKGTKRLYRNPDEKVLGGVCSGIAAYFHLDPVWVRLAFVLFLVAGGAGILLYLVLWLVMPEARTTTDRLEMRGERITIENIERSLVEELKQLKERLGKMANGTGETLRKTGKVTQTTFETIMHGLFAILRFTFRVVVIIIGFAFTIAGIALLIVISTYLFGGGIDFFRTNNAYTFSFPDFTHILLGHDVTFFFLLITILIILCVPLLMLIYNGLRMILRFPRVRHLGLTAFYVWLIGLMLGGYFAFRVVNLYKDHAEIKQSIKIEKPVTDTLYIALSGKDPSAKYLDQQVYSLLGTSRAVYPSRDELYLLPKVGFIVATDSLFKAERFDYSRGRTAQEAKLRISRMIFSSAISGDTLFIDPFVKIPGGESWRGQEINIRISVPEGKYVHFEPRLRYYMGGGFYSPETGSRNTYQMKEGWLQETNSEMVK